jgi:hypothetical protein
MIETVKQYGKAQAELRQLEDRLQRLQTDHPAPAEGLTTAGAKSKGRELARRRRASCGESATSALAAT